MIFKILTCLDFSLIIFLGNSSLLDGWSKLGAIGILGALLVLVLWKTLPGIQESHESERREVANIHLSALDKLSRSVDNMTAKIESGNQEQLDLLKQVVFERNLDRGNSDEVV